MRKLSTKHKLVEVVTPEGYNELVFADRPKNVAELLANTVTKYGDQEGIISGDSRLTYKQFASLVNNASSGLYHKYGIRKGDRVALMLGNELEFAISFFALAKIGAIAVPLNTAYKGEEIVFQLNDSGSIMLITDPEFRDVIAEVRSEISRLEHICVTGTEEFLELLKEEEYMAVDVQVDEMDGVAIMYTAGTTGRPKGALLFHKGMIATAMNAAEVYDLRAGRDKVLNVVPLFHVTGLAIILLTSIYAGVPIVLMKRFKAADALKVIEAEKITAMVAVITIFWLMLNVPEFDQYDLRSIRILGYGGSPPSSDVVKRLAEKFPGVELSSGYGLTEAHGYDINLPSDEAISKVDSIGFPMPIIDAKVVDDSGKELPPGGPGELLLRGCKVIREYWNNPEATRKTIVDGWLHTGDIAKIDNEGYIYILDRIKDMINRGGEKIYSIEVENMLYRNPKVLEAAVVGVPDPVFGEQVKAALVLKPGEQATPEEIQEFCSRYLAKYKVPKYVEFRKVLPRNPAGKVVKGELIKGEPGEG